MTNVATKKPYLPASGDIAWVDLSPRTGHEQSGHRPCIVVSENAYYKVTGLIVICPITSKIKGLPYEIKLSCTKTMGAILPIHMRSIDPRARYIKFIEKAPLKHLTECRQYLSLIIGAKTE